ncbi:MAG: hypothetical protein UZ22_OP11002000612 [Microgenomates bacterium OLB23]|nr:MAG: hypothetical protein UZ22_OP11002000612 [Microgenomates bacterium OLB23]
MKLHHVTFVLMVVGALNWGLMGLFDLNLVNTLLGTMPMVEKLVYVLVGVSAAYELATHKSYCKLCGGK